MADKCLYEKYAAYCETVGVKPMTETQWSLSNGNLTDAAGKYPAKRQPTK